MKLIECHIENFGNLQNVTYQFQDGLNVIRKENGVGKSTLAAFIRVMFFGFMNETKRNDLENERKRYKPWQGGVYGGQLTFQTGEKTYRIDRTFGAKEKDDVFVLYDVNTGKKSSDYSEAVGQELFQIDEVSFQRTIYIAQNDCGTESTDGIHAKLGNLSELGDDMNRYEKVHSELNNRLNKLDMNKKTGAIYKKKQEISALKESVRKEVPIDRNISEVSAKRKAEKEKREAALKEKDKLQAKISRLAAYKELQGKKEKYEDICKEYQERKKAMEEARAFFPEKLPEESELAKYLNETTTLAGHEKSANLLRLSAAEEEEGKRLGEIFRDGVPTEAVMKEMQEEISLLSKLQLEMAAGQMTPEEKKKLEEFEKRFSGKIPEESNVPEESIIPKESKVQNLLADWNERNGKKNLLGTKQTSLSTLRTVASQNKANSGNVSLVFMVLGAVIGMLGLVGCFIKLIAGVIGLVLGVALFLAGIMSRNKKKEPETDTTPQLAELEREIEEDRKKISEIETSVRDFFAEYQLSYTEETVYQDLNDLLGRLREYNRLKADSDNYAKKNLDKKYKTKEQEIVDYLSIYEDEAEIREGSLSDALQLLKSRAETYQRYMKKSKEYAEAEVAYQSVLQRLRQYISSLSMAPQENLQEQLFDIQNHLRQYQAAEIEFKNVEAVRKQFEETNETESFADLKEPEDVESLEILNERVNTLSEEADHAYSLMTDYDRRLEELDGQKDGIEEDKAALNVAEEELEELTHEYTVCQKTMEYLEIAKTRLSAKYMEPIFNGFQKYYRILTGKEAEDYQVDADLVLTVKEQGLNRDIHFLSSGWQNLLGVCMRMALADAMYQEEKPFLILDDPFVNLDDAKVKGGLEFLNRTKEEYQMIYFTCHESRA